MNRYYVDYSGYCTIEANSPEEAEEKFWTLLENHRLPDEVVDVDNIEMYVI